MDGDWPKRHGRVTSHPGGPPRSAIQHVIPTFVVPAVHPAETFENAPDVVGDVIEGDATVKVSGHNKWLRGVKKVILALRVGGASESPSASSSTRTKMTRSIDRSCYTNASNLWVDTGRASRWDYIESMYNMQVHQSSQHHVPSDHPVGARQGLGLLLKGMAMKTGVQGIPNLAHAKGKFFKGYWTIVVVFGMSKLNK